MMHGDAASVHWKPGNICKVSRVLQSVNEAFSSIVLQLPAASGKLCITAFLGSG